MLEQFSHIITIILLISSIVSPIIVSIINNNHQLNSKKIDIYETAKQKSLQNFIQHSESYITSGSTHSLLEISNFYSAINELYIYFQIDDNNMFQKLLSSTYDGNINNANRELTNILEVLAKQIKKV